MMTLGVSDGTFKKRVDEGNLCASEQCSPDRNRQPRHAASFLGDVATRGKGKGVRKVTRSNQNR